MQNSNSKPNCSCENAKSADVESLALGINGGGVPFGESGPFEAHAPESCRQRFVHRDGVEGHLESGDKEQLPTEPLTLREVISQIVMLCGFLSRKSDYEP